MPSLFFRLQSVGVRYMHKCTFCAQKIHLRLFTILRIVAITFTSVFFALVRANLHLRTFYRPLLRFRNLSPFFFGLSLSLHLDSRRDLISSFAFRSQPSRVALMIIISSSLFRKSVYMVLEDGGVVGCFCPDISNLFFIYLLLTIMLNICSRLSKCIITASDTKVKVGI